MKEVRLACGTTYTLYQLEDASISYVPCTHDTPLFPYAHLKDRQTQVTHKAYGKKFNAWKLKGMRGVQIFTGKPTNRFVDGQREYLVDIDIENRLIRRYPETTQSIIKIYRDACRGDPCIVRTKSDGRRLSGFSPWYDPKRSFMDKVVNGEDDTKTMLLEFFSLGELSRIDDRYAMLEGSLLQIPSVPKTAYQEIHALISEIGTEKSREKRNQTVIETEQISGLDIHWDANGKSQSFPSQYCQATAHSSNRDTVVFFKNDDGSIVGSCINCNEWWYEVKPPQRTSDPKLLQIDTATAPETETFQNQLPIPPFSEVLQHDGEAMQRTIENAPEMEQPPYDSPPLPPLKEVLHAEIEAMRRTIKNAPATVVEAPSFRYFSTEAKQVIQNVLGEDPNAGYRESIPIWTPGYSSLHGLTGSFALNGQPSEVEKRRVFNTMFGTCDVCGAQTTKWIDLYMLSAGEYCDGCHKDYPLGSFLQIELERQVANAVVSASDGFLGDDPLFKDFPLWQAGVITHLAAAMGTGKSTEIRRALLEVTRLNPVARGIICVPRISLARFFAYQFRHADGRSAWGLWHEGGAKRDKFIGDIGAICCLPSLPHVLSEFEAGGGSLENIHLALDEVDFGYQLLNHVTETTIKVKDALRECLKYQGIIAAGQTEFTLALERFSEDVEAEQLIAFYKSAPPVENSVELRLYPDVKGKGDQLVAGAAESINYHLRQHKNVYAFCSTRRDAEVFSEVFAKHNPVVYTALSKGDPRADAVLVHQKLTDSKLFLATGAAGVGLSIHDPQGVTEIVSALVHGVRDACMLVQKGIRNRYRRNITYHLTAYNFALPVPPSKSEAVSLFHEKKKAFAEINPSAVAHAADVYALNSLADAQIETFLKHHFGSIASMQLIITSAMPPLPDNVSGIRDARQKSISEERDAIKERSLEILECIDVKTEYRIRVEGNRGLLTPMPVEQLAHEAANAAMRAVGWSGELPRRARGQSDGEWERACREVLRKFDLKLADTLISEGLDFQGLAQKRDGYLAAHFQKVALGLAVEQAAGVESTAVKSPIFLGQFLKALLDASIEHVTEDELASKIKSVLRSKYGYSTFIDVLLKGEMGVGMHRQCRFLLMASDAEIASWTQGFISDHYPASLRKRGDLYGLVRTQRTDLYLKSFSAWMSAMEILTPDTLPVIAGDPLPDPLQSQKNEAIALRKQGVTLADIVERTGLSLGMVSKVTKSIADEMQKEKVAEARRLRDKENLSFRDIAKRVGVKSHKTVSKWLKR